MLSIIWFDIDFKYEYQYSLILFLMYYSNTNVSCNVESFGMFRVQSIDLMDTCISVFVFGLVYS